MKETLQFHFGPAKYLDIWYCKLFIWTGYFRSTEWRSGSYDLAAAMLSSSLRNRLNRLHLTSGPWGESYEIAFWVKKIHPSNLLTSLYRNHVWRSKSQGFYIVLFLRRYILYSVLFLPNRTGNDCLCSHCKGGGLAIGAERKLFENAGRLKTFSSNAVGILFVAHGRPSLILWRGIWELATSQS